MTTSKLLGQLFLAHRRELQVYLTRKLRDSELAADLTQETFLRYAERPGTDGVAVRQNRSYLFRTAHNLAVDHIRQQQRRSVGQADAGGLPDVADTQPGQEQITEGRERVRMLRSILDQLPERTCRVFALNRIEGMSYAEVARALGISESSVQKHLARGLLHVTRTLREKEKYQ